MPWIIHKKNVVKVGYEVATGKTFAIDHFHESTEDQYDDENQYKIVATKWRLLKKNNDVVQDWSWLIEVTTKERK